ncbi:T9SS type A sorting domain-containing protein [Algibacter amylolyticus]|uniref:T9SS type A sorting domain-containing protein n=1 Tax=Algibacter amylolyticus TaxID=1608400 RepID=A0A5M7B4R1_9FLAO|nr:T9SS type A sorting domain-containing protein [Algibacter amylolyticus]KAA5824516.1 T9SS type A sorting domain-containing protein [Algibacter amylolyticus]MBB5269419.1 hypothetical protein [Algibacter amylolyticus]TSJ75289.1 T9SS type A sorting domain-containing protein [Algibacter amylolyticus]
MKTLKLLLLICSSSLFAQVPANNECTNAEPITIPTASALVISPNFTEATETLDASCNTASVNNKDLWYTFTMPIEGILRISSTSVTNYFTIYDTCGGAEIECSKDDSSFNSLTNGNTYLLRASYQFDNGGAFSLQALTAAANDECTNRETISISISSFTQPNPDSSYASKSIEASCDTANNLYLDVWYEFIMPVNGNVEVTFSNNKQTFTLYDGCTGNELQCFSGIGLFENLSQNSTYILRVAERSTEVGTMNFRLQAYAFALNNDCENAETINVETLNSNTYQTDLRAANESLDSTCEITSDTNFDLWYNFTMPVIGNLKIEQLSGLDTVTLYDSCGGTEISCQSGLQIISGLVENTNYVVRIASISPKNIQPRFQAFAKAENDECGASETLSITTNDFTQYTVDARTATESLNSSCDTDSDINLDLWFDFVMPVTGNLQVSGTTFHLKSTLYDACSGNEIGCFQGNGTFSNLILNTTYKLRVSQKLNDSNSRNFRLQALENIFNDECSSPQNIVVPTEGYITTTTNNGAATNSIITACEPPSESLTVQDVWYSFTMPSTNDIEISHLSENVLGYYALFDACGTTELQCFTNSGFFPNLTQGNEYLLKVGNLSSQSGILSFNMSAQQVALDVNSVSIKNLKLYPNPTTNVFHIEHSGQMNLQNLSVLDLNGRVIKSVKLHDNMKTIDISSLQPSVYIVVIEAANARLIKRIIKQ